MKEGLKDRLALTLRSRKLLAVGTGRRNPPSPQAAGHGLSILTAYILVCVETSYRYVQESGVHFLLHQPMPSQVLLASRNAARYLSARVSIRPEGSLSPSPAVGQACLQPGLPAEKHCAAMENLKWMIFLCLHSFEVFLNLRNMNQNTGKALCTVSLWL